MAGSAVTANLCLCPGTLDDMSGIVLTKETFIDRKPDGHDFAGERPRITQVETLAQLGAYLERKGIERKLEHD